MSDEIPASVRRTRAKKGIEPASEPAPAVNPNLGRQWTVHGEQGRNGIRVGRVTDLDKTSSLIRQMGYTPSESSHPGLCSEVDCKEYERYHGGGLGSIASLSESTLHQHAEKKTGWFRGKTE